MRNVFAFVLSVTALASFDLQAFPLERPWELHDADGKRMGRFLGALGGTASGGVQLSVGGERYMVPILPIYAHGELVSASKVDFESSWLFFKTHDCTGTAYTKPIAFGQAWGVTAIGTTGQVLLYPAAERIEPVSFHSLIDETGTCADSDGSLAVVTLRAPVDITTSYRRPFTIR